MTTLELIDTVNEFNNDLYNTWLKSWKDKSGYTIKLGDNEEVNGDTLEEVYKEAYDYLLSEYEEIEQQNLEFKKGGEHYYQMRDWAERG